jgi:hypothetical protein
MSVPTPTIDALPVAVPAGSPLPRASNGQQLHATGRQP